MLKSTAAALAGAGLADDNVNFYGVDSDGADDVWVSGGGRKIYDQTAGRWEQEATPTGENLTAVVRGSPDVAVGAGGIVLER